MADLDPAHVEAVARQMLASTATNDAALLLTSTDPDVHAALLAALVRAGVLDVEKRCRCSCGGEFGAATHAFNAVHDASPIERRYVTRWENVDVD